MKNTFHIDLMHFIREESGTLYPDQVVSFIHECGMEQEGGGIEKVIQAYEKGFGFEEALNSYFRETFQSPENSPFVRKDPITGAVYTIPSKRSEYDGKIKEKYADFRFNRYLYKDYELNKKFVKVERISVADILIECESWIEIDFTKLENSAGIQLQQFDLKTMLNKVQAYLKNTLHAGRQKPIKRICFDGMCFCGTTYLSLEKETMEICAALEEISARGAAFLNEVYVQNISFYFEQHDNVLSRHNGINFRDTRFFDAVYIRNIKLQGYTDMAEFSFEDARLSKALRINNVVFGNAKLYLFQTILEHNQSIILSNLCFSENSEIDLTGVETPAARIKLVNIEYLPIVKMRFESLYMENVGQCSPDIFLLFKNCKIYNPVYIKNVSQLSFWESHNFSRIVEGNDWKPILKDQRALEDSWTLRRAKVRSKLIMAVYNNRHADYFGVKHNLRNISNLAKAKDFVLLKENFRSAGEYDREDSTFLLYMKYKPYLDAWNKGKNLEELCQNRINKMMYFCLDFIGKYGISPTRIFVIWVLVYVCQIVVKSLDSDLYVFTKDVIDAVNAFLISYFSVAVVRRTLH